MIACLNQENMSTCIYTTSKYKNLYLCKEGFFKGTIFVDLYRPYHECKKN